MYLARGASRSILRIPKAGGPTTVIATSAGAAWDVAVNATSVFWTDADNDTLSRADLDGGSPTVVVADQLFGGIAADDAYLYGSAGTVTGSSTMNRAHLDGSNAPPRRASERHPSYHGRARRGRRVRGTHAPRRQAVSSTTYSVPSGLALRLRAAAVVSQLYVNDQRIGALKRGILRVCCGSGSRR
jgi:hypothetical protein